MDGRPNCRNKAEFFKFLWRGEEAFKKLTVMLAKVMLQETYKQSPKTKPGKSWQKTQTKRLMSARYATFRFRLETRDSTVTPIVLSVVRTIAEVDFSFI